MNLVAWNPLREMESLFDRYQTGLPRVLSGSGEVAEFDWTPRVDVSETDKEYLIHAELPGVSKDAIDISLDNGMLRISGERSAEKDIKERRIHRVERFYGHFSRSFDLPDDANGESVEAKFKDGVLEVHVPRVAARPDHSRKIKIN